MRRPLVSPQCPIGEGETCRGWPDRILFLTYTAWVITVAASVARADQSA
jgi:hypothetical protein